MWFSCSYLSDKQYKVHPKIDGDKFCAWELRYFPECVVGSDQRHFPTMLARSHRFFAAADILPQTDHFLESVQAQRHKEAYTLRNERARMPSQEPTATALTVLPLLPPPTVASIECPEPSIQPLVPAALQTHSSGLQRRRMHERCCSTLALLVLLQGTASCKKTPKAGAARNALATLFKHFLSDSCDRIIRDTCKLQQVEYQTQLTDRQGAPAVKTHDQLCELVMRLQGPQLGALLVATATVVDEKLPCCQLVEAEASAWQESGLWA